MECLDWKWLCEHPYLGAFFWGVVALVLGAIGSSGVRDAGRGATLSLTLYALGAFVAAMALGLGMLAWGQWGYLLAALPAVLVARHAVYLRVSRRRALAFDGRADEDDLRDEGFDRKKFARVFARARAAHDREFQTDAIALRYGVPAFLVAMVGMADFRLLTDDTLSTLAAKLQFDAAVVDNALSGARYATLGAYVYVLIYLGQRSMRRDVTSGAATWSAVMLALGPLVGAVLALVWKKNDTTADWGTRSLYFVAGLSPRYAVAVLEETVRRLWLTRSGAAAQPTEVVPLTELRGITSEIEERLSEEGITEATGLAMTDPLKLYRNTAYDKRQILTWMDEALLVAFFPTSWKALREADVTGAISLAVQYGVVRKLEPTKAAEAFGPLADRLGKNPRLTPEVLRDAACEMYEDAQVNLVWVLYQVNPEDTDDGSDGPSDRVVVTDAAPALASPERPDGWRPGQAFAAAAIVALVAAVWWASAVPFHWPTAAGLAGVALGGAGAVILGASAVRGVAARAALWGGCGALALGAVLVLAWFADGSMPAAWTVGPTLVPLVALLAGAGGGYAAAVRVVPVRAVVAFTNAAFDATNLALFVDDEPVAIDHAAAPRFEVELPGGSCLLRVESQRYKTLERWVDARLARKGRLALELAPKLATGVVVRSRKPFPAGAQVTLTPVGQGAGAAPIAVGAGFHAVPAGAYLLRAGAPGHRSIEKEVEVAEDDQASARVRWRVEQALVTLQLPPGAALATVEVDGVLHALVVAAPPAIRVRPGEHVLVVTYTQPGPPPVPAQPVRKAVTIPPSDCVVAIP